MGMAKTLLKLTLFSIFVLASRFSAAAETIYTCKHILFLGNSLTFMPDVTNTHPVTPTFVKALLDSKNIPNDIEWITAGGHTLENHWSEGEFQYRLEKKHYDCVFIQPYTIEALELPPCFRKLGPNGIPGPEGRENFLVYAKLMIDLVRSKKSIPIVIEPWIYDPHHAWLQDNFECRNFPKSAETWYGGNLEEYQRRLDKGYEDLKTDTGVEVLRIGDLWEKLRDNPDPTLPISAMYQPDHYHPTYLGAFLSALVIAERLSNLPADQFRYCPTQVEPTQAALLEKLAKQFFPSFASAH